MPGLRAVGSRYGLPSISRCFTVVSCPPLLLLFGLMVPLLWCSCFFANVSSATAVVCLQVPEYRQIRRGMQCAVVVLSRSSGFYELTGVTEAYLPELDLFVGRFPLLDKR